jgi:hypothetical protein
MDVCHTPRPCGSHLDDDNSSDLESSADDSHKDSENESSDDNMDDDDEKWVQKELSIKSLLGKY